MRTVSCDHGIGDEECHVIVGWMVRTVSCDHAMEVGTVSCDRGIGDEDSVM